MKKQFIILQRIGFTGMLLLLVFSTLALINAQDKIIAQQKLNDDKMVVMELFTSQGCSSCPPADALLAEYAKAHNEHIIPLSFHVDYWNRLGWTDSFSNSSYSARQQWYSQHLPKGSVYTPQLIVNGRGETVGNNRSAVNGLVQKELAGKSAENILVTDVSIGKNMVSFHYKINSTNADEVMNIALVQKEATTNIRAGENEGVTITNHNIVRSFNTQPATKEGVAQINLPTSFKANEYAIVLYVQSKKDLSVITAVMKNL